MSRPAHLRGQFRASVRKGTLEMRDPNDRAGHRYRWAWVYGRPMRMRLPDKGNFADQAADWEDVSEQMLSQIDAAMAVARLNLRPGVPHPIIDHYVRNAPKR